MTPHPTRQHIFYHLHSKGDIDPYATGWYFSDETDRVVGPHESCSDAIRALGHHQEHLDDQSSPR